MKTSAERAATHAKAAERAANRAEDQARIAGTKRAWRSARTARSQANAAKEEAEAARTQTPNERERELGFQPRTDGEVHARSHRRAAELAEARAIDYACLALGIEPVSAQARTARSWRESRRNQK